MNNKLFNVVMFTAGAVIGSLVTWKIVKTKYEQILQEEIDSVKETWARMGYQESDEETPYEEDGEEDGEEDEDDEWDDSVMTDYAAIASKYSRSSDVENGEEGGGDDEVPYINGPVVITPDEYGDGNYDHDLHCINYYADGVLADDWGVKLDIDETIGLEALEHFGDYAEDTVHVRNERLKADYEVVKDPRNYADMLANDPQMRMYAD